MKCVVCTLFEGHYHFGVAVLVNSLCQSGFKGTVYAGFRGPLPPWAKDAAQAQPDGKWTMSVTPDVRLIFIPIETPAHFTNFKPDFLLLIESLIATESDAVIYCDPDIVINTDWQYLEDWLSCGVALCEDVNSPLSENHPRRIGWRRFFKPTDWELRFRNDSYANAGFIGLPWKYRTLLPVWKEFLAVTTSFLGSDTIVGFPGNAGLKANQMREGAYGFADCFRQPDQDAFNAALEACPEIPTSFLGLQAMDFLDGHAILPHAVGAAKPWTRRYISEAFRGLIPNVVDKVFWIHADGPIKPFAPTQLRSRRFQLAIGAALGRVFRRS